MKKLSRKVISIVMGALMLTLSACATTSLTSNAASYNDCKAFDKVVKSLTVSKPYMTATEIAVVSPAISVGENTCLAKPSNSSAALISLTNSLEKIAVQVALQKSVALKKGA